MLVSLPDLDRPGPTMTTVDRTLGNEILTSSAGAVLTVLLAAEGFTLLRLDQMLTVHMFVGLLLVPPVALKLGSTGYRFARYYTGSPTYREKGPPLIWLRLLAPVLVAMTIAVLASGIALMALGHGSDTLLTIHKVTFVVWGAVFAIHFLAHLPRMLRSVARRAVPGAGARLAAVGAAVSGGVLLAVVLLPAIDDWVRSR